MPALTGDAESPAEQHGLGWRLGWTLAGFAPFIAISTVHLAATFTERPALEAASKAMAIPWFLVFAFRTFTPHLRNKTWSLLVMAHTRCPGVTRSLD